MFERFTEEARQVIVLAQEEARKLRHNYIGTEHVLLGLLREEEGLAARVLESLGITVGEVRAGVVHTVGPGEQALSGQIPFTPRAKQVLELALREAQSLGDSYIDPKHLLLGLVRENEGVAAQILRDFDVDAEKIRQELLKRAASGEGGRVAGPRRSPAPGFGKIEVGLGADVRKLLMAGAARSLERGETEMELSDLLLAIGEDESAMSMLAALLCERSGEAPEPQSNEG